MHRLTIIAAILTVPSAAQRISLPIEVAGVGSIESVQVHLPMRAAQLRLHIHNLKYQNEASVRINAGPWIALSDKTVTLQGLAPNYGGIGGGFSTLKMIMTADVPAGPTELSFRFDETDGSTSAIRILGFNFLTASGKAILPSGRFVIEDPSQWLPPSNDQEDIAAGERLWRTAELSSPRNGRLHAKCASCHAQDGRDLRYFNYSNKSIRSRAMFHGLSAAEGDQIASYIRTLDAPNPGRPWDPPYQPGPGLDAKPVEQWSAGAGLSAVLDTDDASMPYLAPQNDTGKWAANGRVNAREIPIALQLPDWNHWLPRIHPSDAWTDFEDSGFAASYDKIRSRLKKGDAAAYQAVRGDLNSWTVHWSNFITPKVPAAGEWTASRSEAIYSAALWRGVKEWELMQEFQLEGLNRDVFGSQAEPRGWDSGWIFFISPNMQHIPRGAPGLANGTAAANVYFSYAWYHLQLLLNNSNGKLVGTSPIDFGYVYGFVKDMSWTGNNAQASLLLLWLVEGLQASEYGAGPEKGSTGWQPMAGANDPSRLVHPAWESTWRDVSKDDRARFTEAYVRPWFEKIKTFQPEQFYEGRWADPKSIPAADTPDGRFGERLRFTLPRLRQVGVDARLVDEMAAWARTVWPLADWH